MSPIVPEAGLRLDVGLCDEGCCAVCLEAWQG